MPAQRTQKAVAHIGLVALQILVIHEGGKGLIELLASPSRGQERPPPLSSACRCFGAASPLPQTWAKASPRDGPSAGFVLVEIHRGSRRHPAARQ